MPPVLLVMIEFLTLFVGLVVGVQNVELAVSGPVARVEIQSGDRVLARIDGPPWLTRCDFGREPRPSRIDAVAFSSDGSELGRARRWINLPGMRADAEIVGIRDAEGRVEAARLTWSSPEFERPKKVVVTLDGKRLRVREPFRINLLGIPVRPVHVLTAEFEFSPEIVIRRELVFGPEFEGSYGSGLTAVAVMLDDLEELPPPAEMQGWFVGPGEMLDVAAVEKPDARVVVVRDPAAVHRLAKMAPEIENRHKRVRRDSDRRTRLDTFGDDVEIFALSPEPGRPDRRGAPALLFPFSNRPTPGPRGVLTATVGRAPASTLGGPPMMADAVAVAAFRAAEGNGRRAVILLLGPQRSDGSRFGPDVSRRYLRDLRVPLFVWDLSGSEGDAMPGWPDARQVDNVDDLIRRVRAVGYRLEEQRIVWLRGRHLPQEITLSDRAVGIRLAE